VAKERPEAESGAPEYGKPEIKDYGDLRELTASHHPGNTWDVPTGTNVTVSPDFSF
jgi:hypothetical protein